MKLSAVLIGTMLVAASGANAQEKSPLKKVEKDTVKNVKRLIVPAKTLPVRKKVIPHTIKGEKVDSLNTPLYHTPDYCPPCGMG